MSALRGHFIVLVQESGLYLAFSIYSINTCSPVKEWCLLRHSFILSRLSLACVPVFLFLLRLPAVFSVSIVGWPWFPFYLLSVEMPVLLEVGQKSFQHTRPRWWKSTWVGSFPNILAASVSWFIRRTSSLQRWFKLMIQDWLFDYSSAMTRCRAICGCDKTTWSQGD